jgi:uncharacterized membrane protein
MITHSITGAVHLAACCISLFAGTMVLWLPKGTARHRKAGYVYAGSMLIVNATAFMIYRLFSGFGPFHVAAIISLVTLVAGMLPVLLKKPTEGWLPLHYAFMYYSVIGLYAAFISEIVTRVFTSHFGTWVAVGTGVTMFFGVMAFKQLQHKWKTLQ